MPTDVSTNLLRKLDQLDSQYERIGVELLDPEVMADHRKVRALSMKRATLEPMILDYREYQSIQRNAGDLQQMLEDGEDEEVLALAREELPALQERAAAILDAIQRRLLTADEQAIGSIIFEVRAGVGGDEAGIWVGDLLNMYRRFATARGWRVEELQLSPAEHGGFKQAVLSIEGPGVWSTLGYEGGTHQVKRVPATEAQGRVHTSTATVAVLPEPEEVEVKIDPEEVKENVTTSQGPGGQNVNKVATAVHLIHLPTGIEVRMQETKSQGQNRERAWKLLRARLYERQKAEADAARGEQRRKMIGGGERAEKIRTYRWKENIVVDHRVNESFNLSEIMAGNLQPVIDTLVAQDIAERIAAM